MRFPFLRSAMNRLVTLGSLSALLLAGSTAPVRADFVYTDFSSTAGLNLVGSAAQVGNVVRLTPAATQLIGTMWFAASQNAPASFSTTFQFRFTDLGGITDANGLNGGDGIAFNYSNRGNTTVALDTDDFSVFFDTFDNGPDVSSNYVRFFFQGSVLADQDLGALGINLSDTQVHTAVINYAGSSVGVRVDGINVLSVGGVNLGQIAQPTFVGIGAYAGAAFQNQDILNWSFSTPAPTAGAIPEPGTLALLLVGTLTTGAGVLRRRRR
jgi:hypothetical protein